MTFCRWSPSPINTLILDTFLKVIRDGFNTQMLTGFKLGILAGLSYTLALCSTKEKIHCRNITVSLGIASTPLRSSMESSWHGKLVSSRMNCGSGVVQLQQCSNISNNNFTAISFIIIITGQHGVKKIFEDLEPTGHPRSICMPERDTCCEVNVC
jgi:hypothetical protein